MLRVYAELWRVEINNIIWDPPSNVSFFQLVRICGFDLTDNSFYPSAERIWLCMRSNNAGKYYDRSTYRRCRFWKKIIFSDEAHFDLGGYVNKPNFCIWRTENPHTYIKKPTHPKPVTVWCGFWSKAIIGPFFFGPCLTNFCSQKLKRRKLATFGYNRTTLRGTQPKLHSMFCILFLKIALSAAELIGEIKLHTIDNVLKN